MLWVYCIVIIPVAMAGKLGVTALALRLVKMNSREALAVGALVNTRGLVELAVLNTGLDLHLISTTVFSMMLLMALATTFMAAPLLAWIYPPQRAEV